MDIITVVLGADTKKDRTKDSIELIEYAFEKYKMVDIGYILHEKFDELAENEKFKVIKGKNSDVKLKLATHSIGLYPLEKEREKDIKVHVELENILQAPLYKDKKLRRNGCLCGGGSHMQNRYTLKF